jgi:arylsulfatase
MGDLALKRLLSAVTLTCAFLWTTACSRPVVHPEFNVVVVLADTLRADHLASYGYERQTSPFFDQLAGSWIQLVNARSQASCTFPSVNSLLTSRNVFRFYDEATRPGIPADIPALPEILGEHGYFTAAVSASPIVRATPSKHNLRGGFGRGFDIFDESCLWYQSTCVSTRAAKTLPRLREPFFLYLHYMDPHDPYTAMKEHRGSFAGSYQGEHPFIGAGDPNPIDALVRQGTAAETLSAADMGHLFDLYDEEITSFDFGLEKLIETLEANRLMERTIVVVVSDHGESFLEHGTIKHCFTVYDTETRVPFLLYLPRLEMPIRRTTWVENLDVVPTLLDYLGIDAEPYGLEGTSLRDVLESGETDKRRAFSSMASQRSVNDQRYKLIFDIARDRYKLFDLVEDPGETRDIAAENERVLKRLQHELHAWTGRVEKGEDDDERLRKAQEIEDELRDLGYLAGDG